MTVIRSAGVTPSERYLASLADKAFLRLWAYPNTYIDKKSGNKKGVGKEFADLLIVFGNDVLIFSDKAIEFPPGDDIDLAWSRWYRRAVAKSAEQVRGAERWLSGFADRIFLDPLCIQPFPIELPPLDRRRVHGIVVALGANEAAKKYLDDHRGTFLILPSLKGNEHIEKDGDNYRPFAIGDVSPSGSFIHVFDPVALDLLLTELDTVADFNDYLCKRAAFIRSGRLLFACGEEDMLAAFIQNGKQSDERCFIPEELPADLADHKIIIAPGEYDGFISTAEYKRKRKADAVSYVWDRLIELFIEDVLAGTSVEILDTPPDVGLAERGLRIMAAETRFHRRALGQSVSDAMKIAETEKTVRFVRSIVLPKRAVNRNVGYVFLILAFQGDGARPGDHAPPDGYSQYRALRTSLLWVYAYSLFDTHPELETVVAIGMDASEKVTGCRGGSEEIVAFSRPEWTDELRAELQDARQAYGLKPESELRLGASRQNEFPQEGAPFATRQQRRAAERRATKQTRRRI